MRMDILIHVHNLRFTKHDELFEDDWIFLFHSELYKRSNTYD